MENLLSTILEALAEPAVSYIGLGYDRTIGIRAGMDTVVVTGWNTILGLGGCQGYIVTPFLDARGCLIDS